MGDFGFSDLLSGVSTGFDIYSGLQSMSMAGDMYDIAAGSAAVQDKIAKGQWAVAEPVLTAQGKVAESDAAAYLANADARDNLQTTQYRLQQADLDLYEQYEPAMQAQYYQNAQGDLDAYGNTQGTRDEILNARYANQLTGTGLNANLLTTQQDDLDRYNANTGIIDDYYRESSEGLDIGEQVNLAKADVASAFANQSAASNRSMARMGVNPNSGRYADQSRLNATSQAKATAGAATTARTNAEQINYGRLQDATNTLKGSAPSGYATSVSTPTNTNSGLYTANNVTGTGLSGIQGAASASAGLGSSASTMSTLAGVAAQAAGSSFSSAGSGLASWQKNSDWLNSSSLFGNNASAGMPTSTGR